MRITTVSSVKRMIIALHDQRSMSDMGELSAMIISTTVVDEYTAEGMQHTPRLSEHLELLISACHDQSVVLLLLDLNTP